VAEWTTNLADIRIDEQNLWSKVAKADGCWKWTGSVDRDGYAKYSGRMAHRLVYLMTHGSVPIDTELDHLCKVRACVNPDHLEPVPHAENNSRSESPSAVHARQTRCVHGHEFTSENTYKNPNTGKRQCRTCSRLTVARYAQKKREANA
jgi:hypothetical protein